MTTLFIVVPLALIVSALAVAAFVWSVKHGQLDDLSTPALRMLEDETGPPTSTLSTHVESYGTPSGSSQK